MAIGLNHTIVAAHDKDKLASSWRISWGSRRARGRPVCAGAGQRETTLDYMDTDGEIASHTMPSW